MFWLKIIAFILTIISITLSQEINPPSSRSIIGRQLSSVFRRPSRQPALQCPAPSPPLQCPPPPPPDVCPPYPQCPPAPRPQCPPPPPLQCPPRQPPVHCPPSPPPLQCPPPPPLAQCPIPKHCPLTPAPPPFQCPPPPPLHCPPLPPLQVIPPTTIPVPGCEGVVPRHVWNTYQTAVNTFVTSLNAESEGMFLDPFASDLQEEFRNVSGRISQQILKISDGQSRCSITAVANLMRDHPSMNYKFWLKGLYHIVLNRPELSNNLESDPLDTLDGFYMDAPPPPPQFMQPSQLPEWGFILTPTPPTLGVGFQCTGKQGVTSSNDEDILWYFREDLGFNRYHLTWHIQNPTDPDCRNGFTTNCHSDRRGELFYYFHRNLLARYNTERITHGIPSVTPLRMSNNIYINPGYSPNYEGFQGRQASTYLPGDLSAKERKTFNAFIDQIRIVESAILSYGRHKTSSGGHAADELGNIIEASSLSPDMSRYGSIHNKGHVVLASIGSMGGNPRAVIGDLLTSLRDPLFYQWHAFVDSLFQKHKNSLPSYELNGGDFPLSWSPVNARHLSVSTKTNTGPSNTLHTFWRNREYSPQDRFGGECRKHLDHEDFAFNLKIYNQGQTSSMGTIRIFLAPSKNHDGAPLSLAQQEQLIFVLDIFNTLLVPGENIISRKSTWLSTVAPRWNDPDLQRNKGLNSNQEVHCGCGHPHNLLLPQGNDCGDGGEEFDLIAIVTEYSKYPFTYSEPPNAKCLHAPVLCGVADRNFVAKYVDAVLPIGYPFDRRLSTRFNSIQSLASQVGNMIVAKIKIQHHDAILQDGMTWNMLPQAGTFPSNPRCRGQQITSTSTTTTTTSRPRSTMPTPTTEMSTRIPECWYDYFGVRHCHPVPPDSSCMDYNGLKYCQTTTTTTTTESPEQCWYDYYGGKYCSPVPPGSSCGDFNGLKYCHEDQDQESTSTSKPRRIEFPPSTSQPYTECYYDEFMAQHCHTPPPLYNCHYSYGIKYCSPPTQTTKEPSTTPTYTTAITTTTTTPGCSYDQYGRLHCHSVNGSGYGQVAVNNRYTGYGSSHNHNHGRPYNGQNRPSNIGNAYSYGHDHSHGSNQIYGSG